jgi:hypothetical protein
MRKTLLLLLCLLILSQAGAAQIYKNLAGSAEEFNRMRLPAAETLGTRSKSAMIPVKFKNGVWAVDVTVETTDDLKISLLAPDSKTWEIKILTDAGAVNPRDAGLRVEQSEGEVGFDGAKYPAEIFSFAHARGGIWRVEINQPRSSQKAAGEIDGYLVVSGKSAYQIYAALDTLQTLVGRKIGVRASVFDANESSEQNTVETIRGIIETAKAEIVFPNGAKQTVKMRDGGEGVFTADFTPPTAGEYFLQITISGKTAAGEKFIRTSEQAVQVLNDNIRLGKTAYADSLADGRLQINLPANNLKTNRKIIAYAELWGKTADGVETPVAWLGGMTEAGRGARGVSLIFDERWLSRSEAVGDFELRSVRLQDADYFVTLAEAEKINLTIPVLPEKPSEEFSSEITDEMRMGKRPEIAVNEAVGGKLMLVHGYCSGGNSFPVSQFSNYIVFSDPNKNRTHDQFANLIRNFGASYPSFGIVAHSQGGAASLHLYTYYWSGLDYATGNRLIQTVGTPYQGTALAGNLAALGSVFGAGCGYNYDLTYSGAAAWLAGIPSWARAKVHYSTTSFTDVWWRYDYCSLGTDLFLGDPEDGVVERAYAQLPGANNRGHKTGWCHTSGMRDPAQTSDSTRNADMNANAAR